MSKNHLSSHISNNIISKSRKNAYIKDFYNFSEGMIYGGPQKNSIFFFFLKFPFQISYGSSLWESYQWSSKDRPF